MERVSEEILSSIADEERQNMINHPYPPGYYSSLAVEIRNHYIDSAELNFYYGDPNDLSHDIVERIIDKLLGIEPRK